MIDALSAGAPLVELSEKLQLFGQFVGSWDAQVFNYKPDGGTQILDAEWHFGWVLEGRAIQDVWIAPKRGSRSAEEIAGKDYSYRFLLRKTLDHKVYHSGQIALLKKAFS